MKSTPPSISYRSRSSLLLLSVGLLLSISVKAVSPTAAKSGEQAYQHTYYQFLLQYYFQAAVDPDSLTMHGSKHQHQGDAHEEHSAQHQDHKPASDPQKLLGESKKVVAQITQCHMQTIKAFPQPVQQAAFEAASSGVSYPELKNRLADAIAQYQQRSIAAQKEIETITQTALAKANTCVSAAMQSGPLKALQHK